MLWPSLRLRAASLAAGMQVGSTDHMAAEAPLLVSVSRFFVRGRCCSATTFILAFPVDNTGREPRECDWHARSFSLGRRALSYLLFQSTFLEGSRANAVGMHSLFPRAFQLVIEKYFFF